MPDIDFTTTCVVQIVIDNHDGSTSLFTYTRPANPVNLELIADAMDVYDLKKEKHWRFISTIHIARNEEDYYGLRTLNDAPEPTIDELHP